MSDWRAYVRQRLPPLGCPAEREAEIVEELAQQLQDLHDAARRAGASPAAAAARVDAEIHDWHALARDLRRAEHPVTVAAWALAGQEIEPVMSKSNAGQRLFELLREARLSVRALSARPLFAVTTVVIFALGIGTTAVVFSLAYSVLIAPLSYHQPDRLAVVQQVVPEIVDRVPIVGVNARSFTAWEKACRSSCAGMAAVRAVSSTLTGHGEPEGLVGAGVSPSLFDVLGVATLHGRTFNIGDDIPGHDRVVILSHQFWQRRFGGDPAVVGRVISLDGVPVEVIGVLPSTFRVPQLPQLSVPNRVGDPFDVFRPLAWPNELRRSWGEYDHMVVLRLPDGVSAGSAAAELSAIARAEFAEAPIHPYAVVRPLIDGVTADARRPLWLLLGAVAAALLIACVNVAGLVGARWAGRQRELAIRTAMGAGRGRLAQLVALESVVLALTGGVLGYALAAISLRAVLAGAPAAVPRLDEVRLDTTSLVVTAAITLCCALLCSVVPAWRATRVDPSDTLKAGARTVTTGRRWMGIRAWLVGGEVALTTMLLLVGGLLIASFVNVLRVERGFSTARVVAADLELPAARYPDGAARAQFFDALLDGLRDAPGIEVAGLARRLPLEGDATVDAMIVEGDARATAEVPVGNYLQVSAGYFAVVGLPLVRGRLLTPDDHRRRVAIVSERTARTLWPEQEALGRTVKRASRPEGWQIIGIVADAKIRGLERDPGLVAYLPYGLDTRNALSLAVRSNADEATALASARRVVRTLDPDLPLQRVRTLDAVVNEALAMRRFQMRLIAAFGASGLLLACLGVYGVLSNVVESRRTELAIRLALGASPGGVRRLIVREGLRPVVLGLLVGLVAGVTVARAVASLLFGVGPTHPAIIGAVAALVLLVSIVATAGPATRAARTSLAATLRGS